VVELALRARADGDRPVVADGWVLWPPDTEFRFEPAPGVMPGVEGVSRFVTNSMGLRADELLPEHSYRVLTIGGSTTACQYLDQDECWPTRLQGALDGRGGRRVWVGNGGKDGMSSRDHVVQLRYILPHLPELELVVVLAGVNDLLLRLSRDEGYDPDFMDRPDAEGFLLRHAFLGGPETAPAPTATGPFYEELELWSLARRLLGGGAGDVLVSNDPQGLVHETRRLMRSKAWVFHDELPDLTTGLAEYRRNLETLADMAAVRGARLLLVTQPYLWREDLPEELEALLWMAGKGDFLHRRVRQYYSTAAMKRGMDAYNEVMRRAAERRGIECFDLAAVLPQDLTVFYDDVHFNESGARQVAEALAGYLLSRPPFAR